MIPDQIIIVGSGYSVRQNMWSFPIKSLELWEFLRNKFTISLNWGYKWFNPDIEMFCDYDFYNQEKEDLKHLPIVIGPFDDYYVRENKKIESNIYLYNATDKYEKNSWDNIYCYDKETEILTDQGWKYFKDLDTTEKVATLNPKTNKVEYNFPNHYIKKLFNNFLIHEKGKRIDLMVTPEHNMYCKEGGNINFQKYKFIQAQFLGTKKIQYRKSFPFIGKYKHFFYLPKLINPHYNTKYINKIKMNDWLEFFGWFLSEGCCSANCKNGNYKIIISQSREKNPEKCLKIEKNLEKCGFHFCAIKTKTCINYTINHKQLYTYLKQFGKAKDKFIPREFLNLPKCQLKKLFNSLILGDGTFEKKSKRYKYKTISEKLANDIHELGLKLGYSPSIIKTYGGYKNSLCYLIAFNKTKSTTINKINRKNVKYNDYVYCVNVKNHIIYVKRNGQSCWSGNCPQLSGIPAITLGYLLGCKEIFLLGYDCGGDDQGRTHFYQDEFNAICQDGEINRCGVGKFYHPKLKKEVYRTQNYNEIEILNNKWFGPFKNAPKEIKIYNVSPNSKLETFPKITYEDFYQMVKDMKIDKYDLYKQLKTIFDNKINYRNRQ